MTTLLDLTDSAVPKGKVKVPPRPAAAPIAPVTVNGTEITEDDIRTEAQNHPAESPARACAEAARALVVRELLLSEAREKHIVSTPESVGNGKRETDEDAAIRGLLDQEISVPRAHEADCRRYYDANRAKFSSERLYEVRHILFAAPLSDEAGRTEARSGAQAVIKTLSRRPEQFAELALAHSACPSKMQGGSLGQLGKGSTVPEFETVLFSLAEGQLSPVPVPTQFGFHVIQLDRIIEGRQLPFEMVEGRIAAWLEAASWSRAVAQYVGILAGRAEIIGIEFKTSDGPLVQ
jgi:peptidyl-prolyl cis-trans isomerase C